MQTEKYEHHGAIVSVVSAVKGKHREHCLCFSCAKFKPEDEEGTCPIAASLYSFCVEYNLVTPVYECPIYEPKAG
jgi:hypothetical protein